MTRDEAWAIVTEWTAGEALRKHALAVETTMRALARRFGGDEELWGVAGLLHDADYEAFPERHPQATVERLRAAGIVTSPRLELKLRAGDDVLAGLSVWTYDPEVVFGPSRADGRTFLDWWEAAQAGVAGPRSEGGASPGS